MKYPMTLTSFFDDYEYLYCQELEWDYDNFKGNYRVCNLTDCPEDAIITRDLFSADDFIEAIRFGMNLAKKGYTDIDLSILDHYKEEE